MNERIRKLKEQARDFYLLQEDLDCSTKQLHELVDAKFAQLIVKECMSNLYLNGYDDAMIQIKQHFGVEE
jgi:hypothetical protein